METSVVANPKKTQRLCIEKLKLYNFKSYWGERIIGPFHPRFTCVVGPNGSGKSNIVDAMLFVFGRKAQQLRMKRVQDLIHKSAAYPNCDNCRVDVVFCMVEYPEHVGSTKSLPLSDYQIVPGSHFIVGREARSDGTSRYLIDDKTVKRDNVVDLLQSHNIDLEHNRFLILQGEVEQVSLLKPKGRRNDKNELVEGGLLEFLEDVIGSSKYVEPIDKATAEVEEASRQLQAHRESLGISQVKVQDMKEDVKSNVEFCRLKSLLHRWTCLEIYNKKQNGTMNRDSIAENFKVLKEEWKQWKDEVKGSREMIAAKESALIDAHKKLKKVKKGIEMLQKQYEAGEAKDEDIGVSIKTKKAEIYSCQEEIKSLEQKTDRSQIKLDTIEKELPTLTKKHEESIEKLTRLQQEYDEMNAEIEGDLRSLRAEKEIVQTRVAPIFDRHVEVQTEIESTQDAIRKLEELKNKGTTDKQKNEDRINELHQKIEEAKDQRGKLDKEKAQTTKSLCQSKKEGDKFEKSLEEKNAERSDFKKRLSILEDAKGRRQQAASADRIAMTLTEHKESGRIPGLIGNLWSMVTVPDHYAYAMASHTNNDLWLTETVADAEAVVRSAKTERLGRVSCLVAADVERRFSKRYENLERQRRSLPPNAKLLFDCIENIPANLRCAVYSRVTDTIVTENLDEAKHLVFDRKLPHNAVTLKGARVNRNGTLAGGYIKLKPKSGAIEPFDAKEFEHLKREMMRLNSLIAQLKEDLDRSGLTINRLEDQGRKIRDETNQLTLMEEECAKELELREKKQGELTRNAGVKDNAQITAKISVLQHKLSELETTFTSLKDEKVKAEGQIKKVEDRIDECGGPQMVSLKKDLKGLKTTSEALKREVNSKKSELNKLAISIRDVRDSRVPASEEQQKQLQQEIDMLEEKKVENLDHSLELEEKIQRLNQTEKHFQSEYDATATDLQTLHEENDQFQDTENSFNERTQSLRLEAKKEEEIIARHQKELDREIRLWSDIPDVSEIDNISDIGTTTLSEAPKDILAIEEGQEENENHHHEDRDRSTIDLLMRKGHDYSCVDWLKMLNTLTLDDLKHVNHETIAIEIQKAKTQLERFRNIDLSLFDEFKRIIADFKRKQDEFKRVEFAFDEMKRVLDSLQLQRFRMFCKGFFIVANHLKEIYQMITFGGDADLEFVNPDDAFSDGIIFSVRPPKKSWKAISNLSGGEKTLSSLSLIFALHHFKASPLYFLDEIDAALDYRNVAIIAHALALRTTNCQFMIISLRNQMFEKADRLIGTYKIDDSTGIVAIDNDTEDEVVQEGY